MLVGSVSSDISLSPSQGHGTTVDSPEGFFFSIKCEINQALDGPLLAPERSPAGPAEKNLSSQPRQLQRELSDLSGQEGCGTTHRYCFRHKCLGHVSPGTQGRRGCPRPAGPQLPEFIAGAAGDWLVVSVRVKAFHRSTNRCFIGRYGHVSVERPSTSAAMGHVLMFS